MRKSIRRFYTVSKFGLDETVSLGGFGLLMFSPNFFFSLFIFFKEFYDLENF